MNKHGLDRAHSDMLVRQGMAESLLKPAKEPRDEISNSFLAKISRLKPMKMTLVHKGVHAEKADNEQGAFKRTLELHHLVSGCYLLV
jgi:hypothetical protein